ncbi:MAG: hypothetical protein NTX64_02875 [Elusimicrobia bacterium]|nr:hypothetical protein [Elusimicrobiota bacterium]
MPPAPGATMTAGFWLEVAAALAGGAGEMKGTPDAGRTTFGAELLPLLIA